MYLFHLLYYKSSEAESADECFNLKSLKCSVERFAELYNLKEVVYCGELDYRRETTIEEVKDWLKEGVIDLYYPRKDSQRFNETVLSDPSPILEIEAFYWQSGYD